MGSMTGMALAATPMVSAILVEKDQIVTCGAQKNVVSPGTRILAVECCERASRDHLVTKPRAQRVTWHYGKSYIWHLIWRCVMPELSWSEGAFFAVAVCV